MKKIERLTKNVEKALKEKKISFDNPYYNTETFINDALSYIKAIEERRMLVGVMSVSKSGMTRRFIFTAFIPNKKNSYYRQFGNLFKALNFTVNKENEIVVSGCGMDMVFHTNYTIINRLRNLGFLSEKQAYELNQLTPQHI